MLESHVREESCHKEVMLERGRVRKSCKRGVMLESHVREESC
jgi:hypothetical protein